MNKQELLAKRASAFTQMEDLKKRAAEDKRVLTVEERKQWDGWKSEFDQYSKELSDLKQLEEMRAAQLEGQEGHRSSDNDPKPKASKDPQEEKRAYANVFRKAFAYGTRSLTADEANVLRKGQVEARGTDPLIKATDSAGGYLVPELWSDVIYKVMKAYGPMTAIGDSATGQSGLFTNLVTSTGNKINYPTNNDTANVGRRVAENTQRAIKDTAFGNVVVDAFEYTSDIITVSAALARDESFNLPGYLARILAERLGRIINTEFTTGTGSSQPHGILAGSTLGHTADSASALAREDFIKLRASVDPAYRNLPTSAFMITSEVEEALMLLPHGSTDERPLWAPSFRDGEPSTILGAPYVINDDLDDIDAGDKPMLFGDMSAFITRFVGSPIIRFSEHHAWDRNALAWSAEWYADSRYLNTAAIKHLAMAAS